MKPVNRLPALCLLGTTLLSAAPHTAAESLLEHVERTGEFSTLLEALEISGLKEVLAGAGPYTLFAPNDAAFDKLQPGTLRILLSPGNRDGLAEIMQYHVVEGSVDLATATSTGQTLVSMLGQEIEVSDMDGIALNDESRVIESSIVTDNGIIHVIDSVIFPE